MPWYNLFDEEPAKWNRMTARANARAFCSEIERLKRSWTLILLGRKVCDAFRIEQPEWLGWYRSLDWGPMVAVPHPSGLNRWWNDKENERRAAVLLSSIATGRLPSFDYKKKDGTE